MTHKFLVTTLIILNIALRSSAQNEMIMNKQINQTAPVKCSKSILINAPSKKVWDILTNINNWDKWQTEISSPRLKDSIKIGAEFEWKTGGAKINSTLHTVKPYQAFGWTGKTFGMFAVHNWTIAETNGTTVVTVNESMEGFLASLFKKSFNRNLASGMANWLELLKKECEK